jgi:predicted dehydrogenase
MQKFKIGIIGAGSIVETNHLPAIRVLQQTEVLWIYDKSDYRMNLVSKMYNIPPLNNQPVEKALGDVDICLVAIPYGVREPFIESCKKLRKALVIEKPFAFSRQEHTGYCNGFKEWEIGVNFQRRFYQSVGILHKIINTGIFGKLQNIKFLQGNFTLKGGSGYLSDAALSGGGVIAESAIHNLDIILHITHAQDISVGNMRSLNIKGLDYDAIFETEILTEAGKIPAHCEISTLRNLENGLQLQFENAVISCDLSPGGKIFLRGKGFDKTQFSLFDEPGYAQISSEATKVNEAFLIFWQQFLSGMEDKTANATSAYNSLLTSAWIEQVYTKMNRQ